MLTDTIALHLERDRLEHRMRRMEIVTSDLRDRAVYRRAETGTIPAPLGQAIESFEAEIVAMRRRLSELSRPDVSARPVEPAVGPA